MPFRPRLSAVLLVVAVSSLPRVAAGGGFGLFQHGGRATGQAGAMVARADDATAVSYNPAALVRLDGWQVVAGIDFAAPRSDYESASGDFAAHHLIAFTPALYVGYHPPHADWAVGLSIDSPFWYLEDWRPVDFAGRFRSRRTEVTLLELHPTFAWSLSPEWAVGGGLRYVRGTLGQGENALYAFPGEFGEPVPLEVLRLAEGTGDGLGFDLAAHFTADIWGAGASLRSAIEVEADADVSYRPRDLVDPVLIGIFERDFRGFSERLEWTLPSELRLGAWLAPYPELRLELDLAWARWSELDDRSSVFNPRIFELVAVRERNWNDTLAIRLGAEGDLGEAFAIFGGLAYEPSPVPSATIEPGFSRGDALIYAVGVSWHAERATFDLGYSFHDHQSAGASRQELDPAISGTYSARDQVWSASARLRFD